MGGLGWKQQDRQETTATATAPARVLPLCPGDGAPGPRRSLSVQLGILVFFFCHIPFPFYQEVILPVLKYTQNQTICHQLYRLLDESDGKESHLQCRRPGFDP